MNNKKTIKHYIFRLLKRKKIIKVMRFIFPVDKNNHYVNIGGGAWYYPRWENIDFSEVIDGFFIDYKIDLNKEQKLPFEDDTVEIIFSSHCLYYLTAKAGIKLLKDCYRVMKQNGVIRIVVTDFDNAPKEYSGANNCQPGTLTYYSYPKLYELLNKIGFRDIQQLTRKKSFVKVLTRTAFNCSPTNLWYRDKWSIFVEAKK